MSFKTNFWNRWVLFWVAALTAAGVHMFLVKVTTSLPIGNDTPVSKALFDANSHFYGYDSIEQLHGRAQRFPSIDERVRVYMSNWYAPACKDNTSSAKSYVSYRVIHGALQDQVIVEELLTFNGSNNETTPRRFLIDSQNTLGKLHFLDDRTGNMLPHNCDSEYCVDMVRHVLPSLNRVNIQNVPIIFQFSDEETSRAFSIGSQSNETYPAVPHFKKSRLSLLHPRKNLDDRHISCHRPFPFPAVNVVGCQPETPPHFHPNLPWYEKRNSVVFRGTLTGMLPSSSNFSMAYRSNSGLEFLSDDTAYFKCQLLDRCRLVYEANAFGQIHPNTFLVDVKLVTPRLQHIDIPDTIHNISLFGDRMTKQGLMKHKAIVMLEGNDAGTGFKWALFSNSVVMAPDTPKFTSWAMEELLVPWYHFIPLDPKNFGVDLYNKMQWIVDHDEEAQRIAQQGSLWIRDLWLHPNANRDDAQIIDDMVRRYASHFHLDTSLHL